MTLIGKQTTEPEIRPYRDRFNEGFVAGIVGSVTSSEIADVARILSGMPVSEWLSDPTRQYACGLLAGWLPTQSPSAVLHAQPNASVPES